MTEVTQKDVCNAFKNIGAVPGDVVIFHSSLKSMGHVAGGAEAVINGILDAVGSTGTVAAATLWWDGGKEKTPDHFDIKNSPAYNGATAEAMRKDVRALRSNHYSHSVSAIGAKAVDLTCEHGTGKAYPDPWNETAFSEKSPWTKLIEYNALYCFIGCTMNVCTLKHRIEGEFVQDMLERLPEDTRMFYRQKLRYKRNPGCWAVFDIEKMQQKFAEEHLLAQSTLGNAKLIGIRSQTLLTRAKELLVSDPANWFVDKAFLAWIDEVSTTA
ncbi:MAG: AAC(3) family N-acetyltransferase [Lentisphaeria bacterium]|nr:AAC(3) family N-acetyltransferase [Lentisphaeria bacterium]